MRYPVFCRWYRFAARIFAAGKASGSRLDTGRILATIALLLAGSALQGAVGAQELPSASITPAAGGKVGGKQALAEAEAAGIDFAAVIGTVRHHIAPAADDGSGLAVESRLYRAEFGPGGYTLTLRQRLSEQALAARRTSWQEAHRPMPSDVTQHPV